jgi:hypothetical protein
LYAVGQGLVYRDHGVKLFLVLCAVP